MTVETLISADNFVGGGTATPRDIGFPIMDPAYLVVEIEGAALVLDADYTISGDYAAGLGVINPVAAWPLGITVYYWRETAVVQRASIPAGQPLPSLSLERQLDRQTQVQQELLEKTSRAVLMPVAGAPEGYMPAVQGDQFVFVPPVKIDLDEEALAFQLDQMLSEPHASWPFVATAGQTVLTAAGSAAFICAVTVNGVPAGDGEDYSRDGDNFTFVDAFSANDQILILPLRDIATLGQHGGNVGLTDNDGRPTNVQAVFTRQTPVFAYKTGESLADRSARFGQFLLAGAAAGGLIVPRAELALTPVALAGGMTLDLSPDTVLDFSGTASDGITVGNETLTALPPLAANVIARTATVTFLSAPALERGQWFMLYVAADYSWLNSTIAPGRPYYRAGEWLRVEDVTGNVVTVDSPILHDYAFVSTSALKPDLKKFSLLGGHIKGHVGPAGNYVALLLRNIERSQLDLSVSNAEAAGISLQRCLEMDVRLFMSDYSDSVDLNYGIVTAASAYCIIHNSRIRTERHAVAFSGGSIPGSIPNRHNYVDDSVMDGGLIAFDSHGSCEYVGARNCTIRGGVNLAGDYTDLIDCSVWANRDDLLPGQAIRFRERKGVNATIIGTTVYGTRAVDDSSALIDLRCPLLTEQGGVTKLDVTVRQNGASFTNMVLISGTTAAGQEWDIDARVSYSADNTTSNTPTFRLGSTSDVSKFRNVDLALWDVSPRAVNWNCRYVSLTGRALRSANDGASFEFVVASHRQTLSIDNFTTSGCQTSGVRVIGPGKTESFSAKIAGLTSFANARNAGAAASAKTSLYLNGCKKVLIASSMLGDDQDVPTQSYAITAQDCGSVRARAGVQMGADLPNLSTGNTEFLVD